MKLQKYQEAHLKIILELLKVKQKIQDLIEKHQTKDIYFQKKAQQIIDYLKLIKQWNIKK